MTTPSDSSKGPQEPQIPTPEAESCFQNYRSKAQKKYPNPLFRSDLEAMRHLIHEELPFPPELKDTSIRVPGSKRKGYSSVYVNKICLQTDYQLINSIHPSLETLHDFFELSCRLNPDNDCLGERKFVNGSYEKRFSFQDFKTIRQRKINIGSGVLKFLKENEFMDPSNFDFSTFILTLYSRNRLEWLLTDLACQSYSIANTSLYDTLGTESSHYILQLTESPLVICSLDKLDKLLEFKRRDDLPHLIGIVCMDELDHRHVKHIAEFYKIGVKLISFSTLERLGLDSPQPFNPPTPKTLYTLSFTSGTTGKPKGVMLDHGTAALSISFTLIHMRKFKREGQKYSLSFLPLAHIFERLMSMFSLSNGIGVGFPPSNDPDLLIENLKLLQPSYLACVPRVYSRLESLVKIHLKNQLAQGHGAPSVEDFKKFLGVEKMEFFLTASAPISAKTLQFISETVQVPFMQLYGLTETYAALFLSSGFDFSGSSGPTGSSCEIKIKGMPELNYHVECPKTGQELDVVGGELLMRGAQLFTGYYKNEKLTRELVDEEGWFHTGDIAKVSEKGVISIVDRVKNFFKLQQGEYVIPEKIENIYLSSNPLLTQLFVHGDSDKNYLIGIAGINIGYVRQLLAEKATGITPAVHNVDELVNHEDERKLIDALNSSPQLKKLILQEINNDIVHSTLQGFEKLHNIFVDLEPLKLSDDLMTPTMKLKRINCKRLFKDRLSELYAEGSLIRDAKL